MKPIFIFIVGIAISYTSIAQTKFYYNGKGGMAKAVYVGMNTCPHSTSGVPPANQLNVEAESRMLQQNDQQSVNAFSFKALPNPASLTSRVECYFPTDDNITLKLTNSVGVTLFVVKAGHQKAGRLTHVQDVRTLPAGSYWWVLDTKSGRSVIQWVKM